MGVNYFVALHNENWPTMQALQECIGRRAWPVIVGKADHPRWTLPLERTPGTLGFPVLFKGEPIDLEASFVVLSPTQSFGYTLENAHERNEPKPETSFVYGGYKRTYSIGTTGFKPININEQLARMGASHVHFGYGDRVLSVTFMSNKKEWQAGLYVMSALIKCFCGYGFNESGQHGKSSYADLLLAEAEKLGSQK
jgi:hypothetical protein